MDKKTITTLLVVLSSSFVGSAFANNIVNKLITKNNTATPSIIKTHKSPKQTNFGYIDFSGTWLVNCGSGPSVSTVIENSADYITLDGNEFRIGKGLQGKYESNDDEVRHEHISFEWSADRSALELRAVDVMKDNRDNSAIHTDISTAALTMKNGQINLDGKWTEYKDVTQTREPVSVHCVFTKKQ